MGLQSSLHVLSNNSRCCVFDDSIHIVSLLFHLRGIGTLNGFLAGLPAGSPVPFSPVNRFKCGGCDAILVVAHVTGTRLFAHSMREFEG
jgi:hypothetical protein